MHLGFETSPGNDVEMSRKFADRNLTILSRFIGISTAIVTCGIGVHFAYNGHSLGFYILILSAIIFFLEMQWTISALIQMFTWNNEITETHCWSTTLVITSGWRRALLYLPIACLLAWKPYKLWLSYFDAGLLIILSIVHVTLSALEYHSTCQSSESANTMDESLLNTTNCYNHFEEVLVTEVLDDYIPHQTTFSEKSKEL